VSNIVTAKITIKHLDFVGSDHGESYINLISLHKYTNTSPGGWGLKVNPPKIVFTGYTPPNFEKESHKGDVVWLNSDDSAKLDFNRYT
jgi:hypothetical protein